jgi:hypothetical protein
MSYNARFQVGARVRVADETVLRRFLYPEWALHHPLDPGLLRLAGTTQVVQSVGFYHGGDALYRLLNADGTWHEGALVAEDA